MRNSRHPLLSDRFGVLGQRKILSFSVLVIRSGGIGPTFLLFLADSGVGRIMVVYHNDVKVYNLHWQVIHTKGRRETIKARSACNSMRDLNPTLSVMAVVYPLSWDNSMELMRGNDCVMDTIDIPFKRYLINGS